MMAKKIFRIAEWIALAAVVTIVSLVYYLNRPVLCNRIIHLPAGSGGMIIAYLKRSGVDVNALDGWLLRFFGYPQKGWIDMGKSRMKKGDFLYKLTHAKAALESVTLIPGETREIFFEQLSKRFGYDPKRLQKAYERYAPYPDGVIFPDTYRVPKGIGESHLLYYLVSRSMARHRRLAEKFFGKYDPKQWFRYVTIASIIQKEAADEEEMPLVASVIYNRLKKGMPLQMDGSLNYGRFSHIKVTAGRIRQDTSLFNTYKHKGLPPRPVGSVSLEAIKAAIKPAQTDFLYFVKGKNGRHVFTNRYSDHLRVLRSVNK